MKNLKFPLIMLCLVLSTINTNAQSDSDQVQRACMDYLEGFYEGDTTKLIRSLQTDLYKFGFWKDENTKKFGRPIYMSFVEALEYASDIKSKNQMADPNSPKKVELLDVSEITAAAKVTAWWGQDYLLLSKREGVWKIEQVLWEGPSK